MTTRARSLNRLIEERAAASPGRVLAIDRDGARMTFDDLRRRRDRMVDALRGAGIEPGDTVAWQAPTSMETMVLFAALRETGARQVPILPNHRGNEVSFIVRQSHATAYVHPGNWGGFDYAAMARDCLQGLRVTPLELATLAVASESSTISAETTVHATTRSATPWAEPYVFYTSGTTAAPRGARHSDRALRAAGEAMVEAFQLTDRDRVSYVAPFAHIAGGVYLWAALITGATLLIDDTFDRQKTIAMLRREGVTVAGAGTYFLQTYLAAQLELGAGEQLFPEVRAFQSGGAPKPMHLHDALRRAFGGAGAISGYGLTEAPFLTMSAPTDPADVLARAEGRPVRGVSIRIVGPDGGDLDSGHEGEILVTAPQLTSGYLDESETKAAFTADGWFKTGDLGRLDEAGNLYITGRLKDVIIRKGENISAREVELAIAQHPRVADVAVIAIPDEERGELACAVMTLTPGSAPIDLSELSAFLLGLELNKRKLPEKIETVPVIPRNAAGKVSKTELHRWISDLAHSLPSTEEERNERS